MADGSKPPHKFTDLCGEIMMLSTDGAKNPLFDAVIPITSGHQN
jgi:hypothetical protein